MSKKYEGKVIVICGPNGLGKSVQAIELAYKMQMHGLTTEYLKYPIYDLHPTGPQIDHQLRHNGEMTDYELQMLFAQNRKDFDPILRDMLKSGVNVVAEDYVGTGIAWGMAKGIIMEQLEEMNRGLVEPDMTILLDGNQFSTGIERGHRYESSSESWCKAREMFLLLGEKLGWEILNANQSKERVSEQVWDIVRLGLNK